MDLPNINEVPTEAIRNILLQRQIPNEYLEDKTREEVIQIYQKLVVPLPQRPRPPQRDNSISLANTTGNVRMLKRKAKEDSGDSVSTEKILKINSGLNDLTIKACMSREDDHMDVDNPRNNFVVKES